MLKFFQDANTNQADHKYSVYDFYYRIKKVEKICNKEGLDGNQVMKLIFELAILLINGIDGRDNYEYIKLTNWIFLGYSGIEVESNEFLDQIYCDMVILIKKDHLCFYSDFEGYQAVKHQLSLLPNVKVFTPNEAENDNKDESELLKISQFYKMMQGVSKVGVLLGQKDNGKLKNIEKWPLIQSYGIQELGNGFFSMVHKPVDLTARINALYKAHDKHSLKNLINVISQRIQGHIDGAMGSIADIKVKKRPAINEEQVFLVSFNYSQLVELFKDTFEIEQMNKYLKRENLEEPRVLIGENTNGNKTEGSKEIGENKHLTIETYDLLSSLKCARTYFLTKQVRVEEKVTPLLNEDEHFVEGYAHSVVEQESYGEEAVLMRIYSTLIVGLQEVLVLISKDYRNMTEQFVKKFYLGKLEEVEKELKHEENLEVELRCLNSVGDEGVINFKDAISFKLTPYFFVVRVKYSNIRQGGRLLGAVLLSDSFILQENCYYVLTKSVPYIRCFATRPEYSDDIELMKKRLVMPELGKQLLNEMCENNRLFVSTDMLTNFGIDVPILQCAYMIHERGLRVQNDQLGWLLVLFKDLSNIVFTSAMETVWMLCDLQHPLCLESLGCRRVGFEFVGKAVEGVFFNIKKALDEGKVPYKYVAHTPLDFRRSYLAQKEILKQGGNKILIQNQITDAKFLLEFLESKQLTILNQMKDLKLSAFKQVYEEQKEQAEEDKRVGLVLIVGSHSSGKQRFAQSLLRYGSENDVDVHAMNFGVLELSQLDASGWLSKLESQLKDIVKQKPSRRTVLLCVVPFYLEAVELVQHIEGSLSKVAYVRSVVSKINANNFYADDHNQIVDGLISRSLPGFASAVILDTFGNYESDVDDLLKLIRTTCQGVDVYRLNNNVVQSSVAKAILADASYSSPHSLFLRTKMNALRSKPHSLDRLFVPWKLPFLKTTRKLFADFIRYPHTSQDNSPTKKNASYEEQELHKLLLKVQRIKEELHPDFPRIVYIKGYLRYQDSLDKALYELTANYNYVTDRQLKNITIHIKQSHGVPVPTYYGWQHEQDLGFMVCGHNLTRDYCTKLFSAASVSCPPLKKLLTKDDLSEQTIHQLEFDNRGKRLDHGYFYDGSKFRNEDGLIEPHHPSNHLNYPNSVGLHEFIDEYLEEENAKVKKANEETESSWRRYVEAFNSS